MLRENLLRVWRKIKELNSDIETVTRLHYALGTLRDAVGSIERRRVLM